MALIPRVVSHFILADSHTVTAQSLNINIWLKGEILHFRREQKHKNILRNWRNNSRDVASWFKLNWLKQPLRKCKSIQSSPPKKTQTGLQIDQFPFITVTQFWNVRVAQFLFLLIVNKNAMISPMSLQSHFFQAWIVTTTKFPQQAGLNLLNRVMQFPWNKGK